MLIPCLVVSLALAAPAVITPIDKAATTTIELKGFPDWLEVASGSLWVSNPGLGLIQRIDPATNKLIAEVKVNWPVAAMAAGYDSVWVATRGDKSIARIDAKTNTVKASIPVTIADSEGSVAAGEGGVWVVSDRKGVLTRIDPATDKVAATIEVKPNSSAAMTGFGAVWVSAHDVKKVWALDPRPGK